MASDIISFHISNGGNQLGLPHVFAEVASLDGDHDPTYMRFKFRGGVDALSVIPADSKASEYVVYTAISPEAASRFRAFVSFMIELKAKENGRFFPFYYSSESKPDWDRSAAYLKPKIERAWDNVSEADLGIIMNDPDPFIPMNCMAMVVLACQIAGIDLRKVIPGHDYETDFSNSQGLLSHYVGSASQDDSHRVYSSSGGIGRGPQEAFKQLMLDAGAVSKLVNASNADNTPLPMPNYLVALAKAADVLIPSILAGPK